MLRVAGLDAYTLVRFLHMNLKFSGFCLLYTFAVLVPIYATSEAKSTNSFSALTMDNLKPGSRSLWVCWLSAYIVSACVIYLADEEWRNHMAKRLAFFRIGDPEIPGGNQFLYTVRVEMLPKELRSKLKLAQYFNEQIFPASEEGQEVVSCVVHSTVLGPVKKIIDKSEQAVVNLETAIAQRNHLREVNQTKLDKDADEEKTSTAAASRSCWFSAYFSGGDAEAQLEPTKTLGCLCLSGSGTILEEDDEEEIVATGKLFCSKTVEAVSHFSKALANENRQVAVMQVFAKMKLEEIEQAASNGGAELSPELSKVMSSSGHVTLRSRQAASDASQILLSNDVAGGLEVCLATDPRDVIWENVACDLGSVRSRQFAMSIVIKFFGLFIFIPLLVFCNMFGDIERLSKIPGLTALKTLDPDSFTYVFVTTQVPPLLQATIVGLLPHIFRFVSISVERVKQYSEVQRAVIDRAFGYQLVNVYFTLLGASLASTLQTIIAEPACIFALLGSAVPEVAGYFAQIVLINGLMGTGMELARVVPLVMFKLWAYTDKKGVSKRVKQIRLKPGGDGNDYVSMFPVLVYPGLLFVSMLGLTYAIFVPFMSVVTTLFFALAFVTFKLNVLYVYSPVFESGGDLFPTIYGYLLTGLNFGNATLMAYFIIKEAFIQFVLLIPIFAIVGGFRKYTSTHYLRSINGIGREAAVALDAQNSSHGQELRESFNATLFLQPELNHTPFFSLNEDLIDAGEADSSPNKSGFSSSSKSPPSTRTMSSKPQGEPLGMRLDQPPAFRKSASTSPAPSELSRQSQQQRYLDRTEQTTDGEIEIGLYAAENKGGSDNHDSSANFDLNGPDRGVRRTRSHGNQPR